jgi:hypothetical protein
MDFSSRWFSSLLTQMMPLPSVFVVWDVMFSLPMRDRENSPKLDYLLDFCTASLIRIKPALFRYFTIFFTPNPRVNRCTDWDNHDTDYGVAVMKVFHLHNCPLWTSATLFWKA